MPPCQSKVLKTSTPAELNWVIFRHTSPWWRGQCIGSWHFGQKGGGAFGTGAASVCFGTANHQGAGFLLLASAVGWKVHAPGTASSRICRTRSRTRKLPNAAIVLSVGAEMPLASKYGCGTKSKSGKVQYEHLIGSGLIGVTWKATPR